MENILRSLFKIASYIIPGRDNSTTPEEPYHHPFYSEDDKSIYTGLESNFRKRAAELIYHPLPQKLISHSLALLITPPLILIKYSPLNCGHVYSIDELIAEYKGKRFDHLDSFPLITNDYPEFKLRLEEALDILKDEFKDQGMPTYPINKADFFFSKEEGNTTYIQDTEEGYYITFVNTKPSEPYFYALYGHEIAHYWRVLLGDVYMEGFATLFSKHLALRMQEPKVADYIDQRYSQKSNSAVFNLYKYSFLMMQEIEKVVGWPLLKTILREEFIIARYPGENKRSQKLDIQSWINSLSANKREAVRNIIFKYAPLINEDQKWKEYTDIAFDLPE